MGGEGEGGVSSEGFVAWFHGQRYFCGVVSKLRTFWVPVKEREVIKVGAYYLPWL